MGICLRRSTLMSRGPPVAAAGPWRVAQPDGPHLKTLAAGESKSQYVYRSKVLFPRCSFRGRRRHLPGDGIPEPRDHLGGDRPLGQLPQPERDDSGVVRTGGGIPLRPPPRPGLGAERVEQSTLFFCARKCCEVRHCCIVPGIVCLRRKNGAGTQRERAEVPQERRVPALCPKMVGYEKG
jgi:hypothetical protein